MNADNNFNLMLKSILNGMEALICVCDAETFEIFFLNDSIRQNFGIESSGVGQLCYKLLQKLDAPCETCPYKELHEAPDKVIIWVHNERVKGSVLRKTARLIDWPGGRRAHLEYAIDITELRVTREALEYQNQLLHTVNHISGILLQSKANTFAGDLRCSMGIMGDAAGADRVCIWENFTKDDGRYCRRTYEWAKGVEPQQGKEPAASISYRDISYWDELPEWARILSQGRCINGLVSEMTGNEKEILARQGILAVLAVPIFLDNQFWGFVSFDNCHSRQVFSDNEEKILRSASELIANALIRDHMEKSIRYLESEVDKIYYDPLTGIYNRRYINKNLGRLLLSPSRSKRELCVMMVDIDYFKKYNDTFGHSEGDRCLKIVAETLSHSLVQVDAFAARYGGEEFVIVLPDTDEASARTMAGQLLEAVRRCAIPHPKSDAAACVTISIGVITGKANGKYDDDDFIRYADEMLYRSKRGGRNQYTFARLPAHIE